MPAQAPANAATTLPLEAWLAALAYLSGEDQRRLASAACRTHMALRESRSPARWNFEDNPAEGTDEERHRKEYGFEIPDELAEAWAGTP